MPDTNTSPKHPSARRRTLWVWLAGGILLVGLLVVVALMMLVPRSAFTALPSTPAPATSEAAASPAAPVRTSAPPSAGTPVPAPVSIPTKCEDIYTHDLTPEFDGLVLNPAWAAEPGSTGANALDEAVNDAVTANTSLTCKWGSPQGGSGRGLVTNVAAVDDELETEMLARLASVGQSCYEELDGMRCVIESAPSADGQSGESHFFRDGVWIATRWVNTGPDGYTNDIVAALFD